MCRDACTLYTVQEYTVMVYTVQGVQGYLQCALERGIAFPCVQQERLSLQGYCTDWPLSLNTDPTTQGSSNT